MQYELIKDSLNDLSKPLETILLNRGLTAWKKYLNLDESCVQSFNDLDNMQEAVECFIKHYNKQDKIIIMPDSDTDGYTSSAELYLYIKALNPNYPVEYIMHERNKSHGLADHDYTIPDDTKLFLIADASTNDAKECNELITNGIDVIILDHHVGNVMEEGEEPTKAQVAENNNAIIINNQLSQNYKNKELSGAGVVYRFLQALDEELWEFNADNVIDLCAIGNIADVMDIRSYETRYFIDKGLKNINNPFIKALLDAQSFSTKGIVNVHNIAWYIAPVINAMIRVGSLEERELMFKAFIGEYDEFPYQKRSGEVIQENIYERAARLAKNAKSRQDNIKKKIIKEVESQIDPEDKVFLITSDNEESGLLGLAAMSIADTYQRPTILVKHRTIDGKDVLNGSIRNFDNSPIDNFQQFILDTKTVNWVTGHPNAAGISLNADNVENAKEAFNSALKDVDMTAKYYVDFEIEADELNINFIQTIDSFKQIWGTGIKEPKLAIHNITIKRSDIKVQGKENNSIAFTIDNIKFVQFSMDEDDTLLVWASDWGGEEDDKITIDIVAEVSINEFQGVYTPQVIILESERTS